MEMIRNDMDVIASVRFNRPHSHALNHSNPFHFNANINPRGLENG